MSDRSQFLSVITPIGGTISVQDSPGNFVSGGAEYLRQGVLKAYSAGYAASIAAAPQLRVFGTDAKTYGSGSTSGGKAARYYYPGGNYTVVGKTSGCYYGALNSLTTPVTGATAAIMNRYAISGSYLVVPADLPNVAPWFTSGTTSTPVGGTFTTFPSATAACFGNNSWLTLSTLTATSGEQGYINNANPAGTWTVGASTNVGMTGVKALAYGAGLFVAVGGSASATAGKIATTATVGSAWTDRTSAAGITFGTGEAIYDVVFDGTKFVAVTDTARVITSADGITWAVAAWPFDLNFATGAAIAASNVDLCTDGAGTVVANNNSGGTQASRALFAISTNHGATWNCAQPYIGKAYPSTNFRSMSYANGRWIANLTGDKQACVDIGTSLATPDYIGQQQASTTAQLVRIK